MRTVIALAVPILLLAACGDPTQPPELRDPDPELGRVAFSQSCAPCHVDGDGFDLAFFGFGADDIVRRGVRHVGDAAARDIVAYVESLGIEARGRSHRPFQPTGTQALTDESFWREVVGADGLSDDVITVEWLRELDLRDVAVPIGFPLWSSEDDESDWMPEAPLPDEVLDAEGGVVDDALAAYGDAPTTANLVAAVVAFGRVTGSPDPEDGLLCSGGANEHERPEACFEARRWMSALAALHLLREGETREVPYEVAELWWDTGEVGVSLSFARGDPDRTAVGAWLYMSSVFAPDGFRGTGSGIVEESGYMGQFLQSEGRPRMAVLATLRRMVSQGPVHAERPLQAYRDLQLAALRAPHLMVRDVLELGLDYLLDQQAAGHVPEGEDADHARLFLESTRSTLAEAGGTSDAERDAEIEALIDDVMAGLGD